MGVLDSFDAMDAALTAAGEVDWGAVGEADRRAAIERLARLTDRLAAVDSEVVESYRVAGDWRLDGHRTAAKGVACEAGGSTGRARRRVAVGRRRAEMPVTFAAMHAGEVGVEHQQVLADALAAAKRADQVAVFEESEKLLVDAARTRGFEDFRREVRQWIALVDPDGADVEAIERDALRDVSCAETLDGFDLRGWLTPLGGAEFTTELDRIEQHLFDQDWADARARCGDAATADDLARTPAQRRHDALVEMARRSAACTIDGLAPAARFVVNLHIDWGTYCAEMARHEGRPYEYPDFRLCETEGGTVLAPSQMLSAALAGEVRRIVYDGAGHVIDFGRSRRLATKALRELVFARDRTCAHPKCGLPARRGEIDHEPEWTDGGRTRSRDLEDECDFHNNWKTRNRSRWQRLRRRRPPDNRRWHPRC